MKHAYGPARDHVKILAHLFVEDRHGAVRDWQPGTPLNCLASDVLSPSERLVLLVLWLPVYSAMAPSFTEARVRVVASI